MMYCQGYGTVHQFYYMLKVAGLVLRDDVMLMRGPPGFMATKLVALTLSMLCNVYYLF